MGKHNYKAFDKNNIVKPKSNFSSSFMEKEIDDKLNFGEENEVSTEKEVEVVEESPKVDVIKYKDKEYKLNKEDDAWRDGIVIVLSNMREEPSLTSNILDVLPQGTSIKIYAKQFYNIEFYKIKNGDKEGYLKTDLAKIIN